MDCNPKGALPDAYSGQTFICHAGIVSGFYFGSDRIKRRAFYPESIYIKMTDRKKGESYG